MKEFFLDLVADLAVHRYDLRWLTLEAAQVGGLHTRCRWFGLATRAGVPADALGTPLLWEARFALFLHNAGPRR